MFCKVKAWVEHMESEAETLRFVRKRFDGIPVPEVMYDWVEHISNRSFLLLRPVRGRTLQVAWPSLSHEQRTKVAQNVAECCAILAKETSNSLETATGLWHSRSIPITGETP
jgi:hypothetical protein